MLPATVAWQLTASQPSAQFVLVGHSQLELSADATPSQLLQLTVADFESVRGTDGASLLQSHSQAWAQLWSSGIEAGVYVYVCVV